MRGQAMEVLRGGVWEEGQRAPPRKRGAPRLGTRHPVLLIQTIAFVFPGFAMEPFCLLLLAGVSLPFAKALKGNETTPAESNLTSTTAGPPAPRASRPLLAWLLLPLLLLVVSLLLAAYFFRFRKQRKAVVSANDKKVPNGILEEQEQQRVMLLSRSPSGPKKYFPIPVAHLEEEIRVRSADDCKRFREEFNSLPSGHIQGTFELANKEENREKNRYPNILPNDHSRVILSQVDGAPCSDYINASYIDGYKEKNKFIAAQGPKQETVNDFWRMIWEQKSATIVMLTNLKERKEEKCYQYWPDQGCWTYGNIRVCVEDCVVLVDYTIRKFCIQSLPDGCKAPRLVSQLHFTSWPDFGVPFTPIGMLKFLKKVKALNPAHAGPIVVHCSAGVGRTGTFIVIDAMMDMMHAEHKVDVFDFVSRIRNQRPQMVQTDMQYTFIYQALLEYYLYGDTELDVSSLENHLQTLHGTAAHFDKIGLEEEFRKLTNVRIMKEDMRTGNLPANMKKARVIQIIPYDFNRVILSMKRGQEYTDYINASFIDGYRQKDYFIATQGPLAHTVEDFWRMVWEWKCHTVVMLTEVQEREQDKCYQYWPTEGSVTHGEITIEIKSDTLSEAISIRDFLVTFNQPLARQEEQTRLVRQFHFHGWPEIGIPAEGKGMLDLIAAVQKQQQQTGNHPITVHCSAGAGRTGTFIALSNILERVKAEGLLDVFQAVKSLRLQRPHMVQTLEQYEFCYKVPHGDQVSVAPLSSTPWQKGCQPEG
ncbi:receptor-type tyrosine-protein phosphatase epsilon isoform X2 [Neofelis nebulosa]|uniref:receptor-type tyrosine-protein phosphatase epsilon isoform X2 n=1 Tax=Neofelis nebulosa TaxID=61452 RepID=UPI00272A3C6E|nr:receptor-type tyrosine-protein phosphatase epsilon isoform X2 [Neofelis nebulosa]